MDLALEAQKHSNILEDSIVEGFGCLTSEATGFLFTWLSTNPFVALDIVFGMDKGSWNMSILASKSRRGYTLFGRLATDYVFSKSVRLVRRACRAGRSKVAEAMAEATVLAGRSVRAMQKMRRSIE